MPGQLKQEDHAMPDAPAQASGAVNEDNGITPPRGSESRVRSVSGIYIDFLILRNERFCVSCYSGRGCGVEIV